MSKNNAKMVQQKMSDQRQKFGIRKLSVGVASVLLGTVFYMQGGTVHADVNPTLNASSDSVNVVDENSGTSSLAVGSGTSNSAGSANSTSPVVSASDVTNSIATSQASASPVDSAAGHVSNAAFAVSEQGSVTPASQVNVGVDKIVKDENSNVDSDSTQVSNSQVAPEKSVAGSGSLDLSGATPSQSVLATPAETESPSAKLAVDSKAPNREMVDSKWTIHYVDQADHKQELKAPTVITMQYERTNTPQSDGTTQYGDWSYVPGSFKQTGTPITVYGSDNPTKEDNIITKNGENVDVFTINARYPTIKGYKFHDDHGAFLFNDLLNYDPSGHVQAPRMSGDIYAEYDDVKSLIDENDLTKTVTRTIKIVQPDGTIINKVQTVHLTRSATVDEATNQVKYGAWSTDQWDAYKVPTVDGYTPSHETVEAAMVDGHTYNTYVTITYTQTTHPIVETATKTLTEHFIYGGGDRQGKVAAPDSQIKLFFKRTNQVISDGTVTSYGQWEIDPSQGTNGYQIVSGKWQIPEPGSYDVLRAVAELPDGRKLSVDENHEYHYSSSLAWLNPETSAVDYFEDPDFYDVRAEHTTYVYPVTKYLYVYDQDPKHIGNPLIGSVLLTGYADESRDFTWDDIVAASKHGNVDLTNYELVPGQSQTVTADFEPQSPDLAPINVQHKHRQVQTIDHVKVVLVPALLSILYESAPDMLLTLNSQIDRYGFPLNPTYHEVTVDVPVTLTYDAVTKWVLTAKVTPTTANIQESRYTDDELNGHDYGIAVTSQGSAEYFEAGPDWRKVLAKSSNGYRKQLAKLLGVPDDHTLDEAISKSTLKTAYFTYPKWDRAMNTKQAVTKNQIIIDDGNLSFPDFSDFKGDEPLDHAPRLYDENKQLTDTIGSYQILNWHFPKPVSRTINLHLPSGKVETVTQVVDAGKTVSFNVDHGDDTLELVHSPLEWANYEVPAQAGYTSSQTTVAAQSVDDQTADQTVDIYYTANDHQISIKYVDDDQGEKVVGTGTVNGKTGTEVTITPSLPKGYMLTQGKDVPSTYTVTDSANQAVTIHVQKQFVDTSDTDPQAKQTRTITLHYVYGAGDKQGQKVFDDAVLNVYYHRTATLDRATNQTKYGDWLWDQSQGDPSTPGYHVVSGKWTNLPQSWANVTADVPSIKGYRADLGQNDPANTNHVPSNVWVYPTWNGAASTGDTLAGYESKAYQTSAHLYEVRPEHTVKYMPNKTTLTVKFVDDQSDEQQVGQATTVTGLDGDTVSLKLTVPDKYQLADGQQLPTSYTFTKGSGDLVIHLTHKVVQREATTNVYMFEIPYVDIGVDGLVPVIPKDQWDLIGMDDYGRPENFDALKKQLGTISGHVNYDLVTNQVTSVLDDWTSLDLQNQTFSVPKADAVVNGVMSYSEDTNGKTILEWMKENNWQGSFTDYLEHPFKAYLSQQLTKSAEMTGGPSFYRVIAPKVVPGEPDRFANEHGDTAGSAFKLTERIDRSYLETHQHSFDWKGGDSNDFRDQGGRLVSDSLLQVSYVYMPYIEKAVTRTIIVAKPDGTKQQVIQTAALDKAVNISYSDKMSWSTGEWTSYDAPAISGYTASQRQVARQAVTGETKDQTVNITYTANPQMTTVVYQTEDGTPVHTTTINGHTGQTVEVPSEVPAGWMIIKGQVPSEITFGPNGYADETIIIGHRHVTVDPDHSQTNGTKLPDNSAKTFNGVEANDLNKTITRTIKVTTPDGQTKTVTQSVKLTRNADVDEVTGEVTYGKWTTGQWDVYEVPTVQGYTANQNEVSAVEVTSDTIDQTINVSYTRIAKPVVETATRTLTEHFIHLLGKRKGQPAVPDSQIKLFFKRINQVATDGTVLSYGQWELDPSQGTNGYQVLSGKWQVPQPGSYDPLRVVVDLPNGGDIANENSEYHYSSSLVWLNPELSAVDYFEDPDFYDVRAEHTTFVVPVRTIITLFDQDLDHPGDPFPRSVIFSGFKDDARVLTWDEIAAEGAKYGMPNLADYELVPGQDLTVNFDQPEVYMNLKIRHKHQQVQTIDHLNVVLIPTLFGNDEYPAEYWLGPNEYLGNQDKFGNNLAELMASYKQVSIDVPVTLTVDQVTKEIIDSHADLSKLDLQGLQLRYDDQMLNGHDYGFVRMSEYQDFLGPDWHKALFNMWDLKRDQLAKLLNVSDDEALNQALSSATLETAYFVIPEGTGDHINNYYTVEKNTIARDRIPLDTANPVLGLHQTYDESKPLNTTLVSSQILYLHFPRLVTRTINLHLPNGKLETVRQTADIGKSVNNNRHDEFELVATEHDHQQWAAYEVPSQAGYTASQTSVAATPVDGNTKDQTIDVYYTANSQTTHINYVDGNGETVHITTVNGVTGQTVKVPNEVPAGWMITKGQVPSEITFGPNGYADETITIGHRHVTVDPDHPQTNGTKLPDNSAKTFNGVEANDLNKTITRTIKVTTPDGKVTTTKQTAKLTRTASVDEVSGAVTYGDWTTGEWAAYDVPSVAGYTPSQKTISSITVKSGDKDVEETVIYSPNKQVMTINYIDDVTGKTLSTKQLIGVSDGSANYNTKSSINSYVVDHYKLVSDDTNSDNLVFDHDDSTDQVYNVHLTHTYQMVDDHKAVNETVHYVYDNGQTARPDYKAPVINFSRTGTKDLVTSNIVWNAWTPAQQSFDQVTIPAINGYTPDVEVVPSVNVNHVSADVERTVIYHADDQTILVNYIDDDTHSTLKTDTVIGKTAQKSNYTTKKLIDGYVADHYELVSDDTNANELVFDSDSTKAQVYNVHLKHVHQNVSDSALVNETIHYIYADGSKARDDYHAPAISFKRTGDKDLVTNAIVWGAWTPVSQAFKAVDSPVIDGYTPSQKTINSITVKPGDKDIDQTVVYAPDTQSIVVNYIDDVTGKTLKTDTLIGKSDLASDYTTKNNITGYENQHYVLVSDDTQGKTLIFDHDDKATQVYNVHLSHQTEPASQSRTVHETINYVYADGSKAADTVTANPLTFTQTGVKDLVNGNIDWNGTWTSKQTFAEVKSPEIIGYTASRKVVDPIIVDHNSSDIHHTVIYVANNQTAKIKYIDDVTGKTLEIDSSNGKFGDQINFGHDVDMQIKAFEGQGYKFKSNSFNGQKYQSDNSQNEFEVHFTHGKQNVSRTNKVTETVKYQFADGRQAQKDHVQTAEFTQHGVQDLVTKTTVWTPSDPQTFVSVDTPHITGYTADVQNVPEVTVKFGDGDIIKVVTYKANDQLSVIKYIDDVTGKLLDTEAASGKFGTKIEFMHDPSLMIQKFEGRGYKLLSNSFKDQDYQADNSKNQFEVHFTHGTQNVSRMNKVTEIVKYQFADGRQAQKDRVQTAEFMQHGVQDLVTKTTDWAPSDPQTFVSVDSPKIIGYTADVQNVSAVTVKFGDADITKVVTYKANDQLAGIKYIDDTTGKTLETDSVNGKFGDQIKFGHDPSSMIKKFEGQGYKLVSNIFKDQDYQADNSKNEFEVHFKHGMKNVSRTSTITRTIKYVDQNTGKEVHQPVIQTLTFTENGVTDLVTGKTTWDTPGDQQFVKVESPKIDGYENPDILVVDAKTAKFGDSDQTVTVHYKKVEIPSTPDMSKEPNNSSASSSRTTQNESNSSIIPQASSQNASGQQISNNRDENQLPQTGNQDSHQAGLIGLMSLTLAGLLGFGKRRKKND